MKKSSLMIAATLLAIGSTGAWAQSKPQASGPGPGHNQPGAVSNQNQTSSGGQDRCQSIADRGERQACLAQATPRPGSNPDGGKPAMRDKPPQSQPGSGAMTR